MAEETITILKVGTDEAVKSVGDLQDNIKALKGQLKDLEIGTEEYQETLGELKTNQNALKDAMYATSASMEDLAKAANGASETYNGLVHKMADLKTQLRATDVSTEAGKEKFRQLASEINSVNDKLKEMDAMQGNYQRNVGNYKSAISGLADVLKSMPPTLGKVGNEVQHVGTAVGLLGKQPILGIIGLLAPVIMKITSELKENDTAINAVKKGMEALKPVTDFLAGVLQKIADLLSKAVDWFVDLTKESGETFSKIIAGAVGVGNVLLQFILTPIKSIISAFKGLGSILKDVFTGQFKQVKDDAVEAWEGIKDAFTNGFSFAQNFAEGQRVGEEFLKGLKSVKPKAKQGIADVVKEGADEGIKELEKAFERALAAAEKYHDYWRKEMESFEKDMADDQKNLSDEIDAIWDAQVDADLKAKAEIERLAEERMQIMQTSAGATASLLGAIADAYEAEAGESEKATQQIKGLRIAAATIDTISGAIAAYMNAVKSIPDPITGQIVGAVQAAAVTAAGVAQIAKIKATKVGSGSSSGTATPTVTAPTVSPNIPQYTRVTGASEEDRLNRMAGDQRVYILQSDIEAAGRTSRVQVAESSF